MTSEEDTGGLAKIYTEAYDIMDHPVDRCSKTKKRRQSGGANGEEVNLEV